MFMRLLTLTILSLFWATYAYSNPQILSISGKVYHGSTITIVGSFFGTKPTAAPVIWDDCESGVIGDLWDSIVPNQAADANYNMQYRTTYRGIAQAHSNSSQYAVGGHHPGPPDNAYAGWNVAVGKDTVFGGMGEHVYCSWYYRTDPLWPSVNNNYKLWAYQSSYYNAGDAIYVNYVTDGATDWEFHLNTHGGCLSWVDNDATDPRTEWLKIEIEAKMTNDNTGWIKIHENGVLKYSDSGCATIGDSATPAMVKFGSFWRMTTLENGHVDGFRYLDDIYFDQTLSRVIIGNASTLAASTIREIQIPSAWSSTSITITNNQGALAPCETVYLFVVDADGNVNAEGYPIYMVTGAGEAPCPPTAVEIK